MNRQEVPHYCGREQASAPCRSGRTRWRARALGALGLLLAASHAGPAAAHGGVAMDKDVCKLRLGPYTMHFTGYQVRSFGGNTEFCEDIPALGKTILVMDAVDPVLREMPITARIIRDVGGGGNMAPMGAELEKQTIIKLPEKVYPTGSLSIEYDFQQPGDFIGVVTAGPHGEYVSMFPFSVGINRSAYWLYATLAAIPIFIFGLFAYSARNRKTAVKG
jgi:hypothetical protein